MRLEPYRLAREARDLSLDLPSESFPRFHDLIESAESPISVRAHFDRDEQGRVVVEGRLACVVRLRCGNCLAVEPVALDLPISLCVVAGEPQARALLSEIDPLVLEGTEATPAALFEDDLLLGLPERPCGMDPACPNRPPEVHEEVVVASTEDDGPFAALAALRRDDGDERGH